LSRSFDGVVMAERSRSVLDARRHQRTLAASTLPPGCPHHYGSARPAA
jgi:hypothetical protein